LYWTENNDNSKQDHSESSDLCQGRSGPDRESGSGSSGLTQESGSGGSAPDQADLAQIRQIRPGSGVWIRQIQSGLEVQIQMTSRI